MWTTCVSVDTLRLTHLAGQITGAAISSPPHPSLVNWITGAQMKFTDGGSVLFTFMPIEGLQNHKTGFRLCLG